jgi:predicted oxidoreductase
VTRSVVALAWLLRHPARIIPIVGSTVPERIRDSVNATEIELRRDEWYRLMEAAKGQRLP